MSDVFNGNPVTEPTPAPVTTQEQAAIDLLVGEGKKYKTVEDLAKSRLEADEFIERLKRENAEMRGTLTEKEAEYERILKARQESTTTQPTQVKPDEIAGLVDERIKAVEAQRSAEQNLKAANDELVGKFGGDMDQAKKYLVAKAQELGVTVDYLKAQAMQSPTVFKHLVGGPEAKPGTPAPATAVSTTSSAPTSGIREGTWAFYEQLRKTNPSRYFSPEIQNKMFRDRKEKGQTFYS